MTIMAKNKVVSAKTHTKQQLDDYANQHNPNNKAYKARVENEKATKASSKYEAKKLAKEEAALFEELGLNGSLDWMCYSNPYDFD